MTFIAYSLGGGLAISQGSVFSHGRFWLGYAFLFFLELCTILANELYDQPTDRINYNASPFNGGSRVLVEEKLTPEAVRKAVVVLLCALVGMSFAILLFSNTASRPWVGLLLVTGMVLGLGYTVPPLCFCYRGMGELVVGITHSPYVILCGFLFQANSLGDPRPWMISIPLFFAVLAAITLAGIPDFRADQAVGKKTLSVVFGQKNACLIAMVFATVAVATAGLFLRFLPMGRWGYVLIMVAIPHWIVLALCIGRFIKSQRYDRKINGILQLALTYIIWFAIVPLVGYV
jgi:1,4-dihydroxy-2-naphthoate octaprenyltransferase